MSNRREYFREYRRAERAALKANPPQPTKEIHLDVNTAIFELRKLKPLSQSDHLSGIEHRQEWDRHAPFVNVIEAAVSDPSYVAARNVFIPEASAFADFSTEKLADGTYHSRNWTLNFLERMKYLWRESQRVHVPEIV